MSNLIYPVLNGVTWNIVKKPEFSTIVHKAVSLREFRLSLTPNPLWNYQLTYDYLPETSDYATLLGFFAQHAGSYDSWLFDDTSDDTATQMIFATGDGATTLFNFKRSLGGFGFSETLYYISANPVIRVNGVTKTLGTDYTLGAFISGSSTIRNGTITFTVAPGNGLVIDWTGSYWFRCRFLHDTLEFNKFAQSLWENKKVEFVSAKP